MADGDFYLLSLEIQRFFNPLLSAERKLLVIDYPPTDINNTRLVKVQKSDQTGN